MKRQSYLLIDEKPLRMVPELAPRALPMALARAVVEAAASSKKNAVAVLVVGFVFWAAYFLMNHFGA